MASTQSASGASAQRWLSLATQSPNAEGWIQARRPALPACKPVVRHHSSAVPAAALFVMQEQSRQAEQVAFTLPTRFSIDRVLAFSKDWATTLKRGKPG